MAWLKPQDGEDVVYEFFAPFAHVEGRYEWCRIRSPTHGVFDVFILLDPEGTDTPATVYVNNGPGEAFMRERYPQCTTFRVDAKALRIEEADGGRTVEGRLEAEDGPVRKATMRLAAGEDGTPPQDVAYGGTGGPVWGNPGLTCWGVDLVLPAVADGTLERADGTEETFDKEPAIVTLGSFARIAPREPEQGSGA